MLRKSWLIVSLLMAGYCLSAQELNRDVMLKLNLRDGSIYQGISTLKTIKAITPYGNLEIPVSKLTEIKFKLRYDTAAATALAKKLSASLKTKLSQDQIDNLISENKINLLYAVQKMQTDAMKDNNDAVSENLGNLESQLLELYTDTNETVDSDQINDDLNLVNFSCTITGIGYISLQNRFGKINNIPQAEIASIQVYSKSGTMPDLNLSDYKKFELKANKNIKANENKEEAWLNTKIEVKEGDTISIIATGKIKLASLDGKYYYPSGLAVGATQKDYYDYGAVIYSIGTETGADDTNYKVAGDKLIGTVVEASGTLYLSIYETLYYKTNTGSYNVYVKVSPKKNTQ